MNFVVNFGGTLLMECSDVLLEDLIERRNLKCELSDSYELKRMVLTFIQIRNKTVVKTKRSVNVMLMGGLG